MNDATAAQAAAMAEAAVSALSPSAGTLLRQAREATGLHIGALSAQLKVPVKKLEALEADRHDLLPDAVFARALAASVCRTLKVDPGPILSRLPKQVMPRLQLESSTTDHASLHPPRALWRAPMLARLPKPVAVAVALLLVGAASLYLMPSMSPVTWLSAPDSTGAAAAITALPGTPTGASVAVSDAPALAISGARMSVAELAPAPPIQPGAPATSAVSANVDASVVLFKARGASWVEVTDGAGVLLLRKLLGPGDAVPVSGALPLSVVVGRADAVDVLVRGQPLELRPLARDNVARFQIK